jgi:ribosome-binding factor A
MSNSIRQQKIEGLLQKDLGEIFQQESRSTFGGAFITVTAVRISPDLSYAKVFISVFNPGSKDDALSLIKEKTSYVRGKLGQKIKNQLRIVPELDFRIDDSLDYSERIDQLLKK